ATRNKLYYFETDYSFFASMNGTCWPGQLPLAFTTQSGPATAAISLQVADRPENASRVLIQIQWKEDLDTERATFELNGKPLTNARSLPPEDYPNVNEQSSDRGWTEFETRALQRGKNVFRV